MQSSERSPIYTFLFEPEVLHLDKALSLHLPRVGDEQIMAFYDPLIDDAYTIPATQEPPMHLLLTLPAGDYASEATHSSAVVTQNLQPQATEFDWIPFPTRLALNWLGKSGLWHLVGLPNDKLITDHFVILYNTKDCTPAYAGALLDALEDAYIHFSKQGAYMPSTAVYVKIAPWVATKSAPGSTPRIGTLFHYYMFINNSLTTEALQDTAVHEFMHVLQKTNASPGGRYMNPLWWEEATAIWAQYNLYPSHTTYLNDFQGEGERWLRNPYDAWNGMSTAEMYAAMSLAEYLFQNYGDSAIFNTFQSMGIELGNEIDVAEAIERVTKKDFGDFYEQFAQDYWLQKYEPVKSWNFVEAYTGADAQRNAILRLGINQPVNQVYNAYVPDLSSGLYKIYSVDPLPVSFTRDTASTTGSTFRVANSCTGNLFYFYDSSRNAIPGLNFAGQPLPGFSEILYSKNLGNLIPREPLYMLYIDRSYNYTGNCRPVLTLEQPTITGLSPSSVTKNTTNSITITGEGFGPEKGSVSVAFSSLPAADITYWSPTSITFTWNSGTVPGTVTVQIYTKKAARSNGKTLTITN